MTPLYLSALFAGLAILFGGLAYRDHLRQPAGPNPARKARARVAVIFALVAVVLLIMSRTGA